MHSVSSQSYLQRFIKASAFACIYYGGVKHAVYTGFKVTTETIKIEAYLLKNTLELIFTICIENLNAISENVRTDSYKLTKIVAYSYNTLTLPLKKIDSVYSHVMEVRPYVETSKLPTRNLKAAEIVRKVFMHETQHLVACRVSSKGVKFLLGLKAVTLLPCTFQVHAIVFTVKLVAVSAFLIMKNNSIQIEDRFLDLIDKLGIFLNQKKG